MTSTESKSFARLTPASRIGGLGPYEGPQHEGRIVLSLDANEGAPCCESVAQTLASVEPRSLNRYPDSGALERQIAEYWSVDPSRIVVTNGGDEVIDRICRSMLEPGRIALLHGPTFEMIERSVLLASGVVDRIGWLDGAFPTERFVDAIGETTALIALVTPNNPTGAPIDIADIRAIARAAPDAVVMVDLAYAEFADIDPTRNLQNLPNVVVVRTFSKAMGLAGLRVGYAIAPPVIAGWMRTVGGPYPVSSISLALAANALANATSRSQFIDEVRLERSKLTELLAQLGADPLPSQANFVTASFRDAAFTHAAVASLGIAVRGFFDSKDITDSLRITLPGDPEQFDRLARTLAVAMRPEALLFDLDGVLADVSCSYRAAITETARSFGVEVTLDDVSIAKQAGNANNDWELTKRLLLDHNVSIPLDLVVQRFQCLYLGANSEVGFRESETLIPNTGLLRRLASRVPLAIVTGRPRAEAEWFLDRAGVQDLFSAMVCMEDAQMKPSAEPMLLALRELGVSSAWMIGDTPDDMQSARTAGVVPIGVVAPSDDRVASEASLRGAGAACVIGSLDDLEEMLP